MRYGRAWGARTAAMTGFPRRGARAALLALAFCVGGAGSAQAQAGLLGPGGGFIAVGLSEIGTGELDERLAARGYPTFGRGAAAVALGAYRVLESGVMLGGEWHGLIIGDEPHEGRRVGIGGGYGTLGVGYAFEVSRRARLYPRLGLGGGGMGLWIESDDEVPFDDVLADPQPAPGRQPVLSRTGMVVDVGAGAELLPGGTDGGPLIGLRLGYLAMPSTGSWRLYDRDATGGPTATIAGPYVRVVVGVAWGR